MATKGAPPAAQTATSALKNQWIPVKRDYAAERKAVPKYQPAPQHPLLDTPEKAGAAKGAASVSPTKAATPGANANPLFDDPLSSALAAEQPTKPALTSTASSTNVLTSNGPVKPTDNFVPWSAMKPGILSTYTTDEQIAITVTFMNTQVAQKVPVDKVKNRLEQLDQSEDEQKQTLQVTQKDYVAHIENLHNELIAAWEAEERVKALKLAIQCAKLLSDVSVIKFYPSKFVLVTEILDTFGKLVYERIKKRQQLPPDAPGKSRSAAERAALQDQLNDQAKETCRNWFYKIASIRELLPRLFTEMAIIRCYDFLKGDPHTGFEEVILRISGMISGVGNPLVAMYTRTYLARRAHDVAPTLKKHLLKGFDDYFLAYKQMEGKKVEQPGVTHAEYLKLYSPALEWQLQCIAHNASHTMLESILERYTENKNAVVLNHIISSFPPDFIASHAHLITKHIRESDGATYPKYQLYRTLGVNLVLGKPPKDQVFPILNDVWKVVTKFENIDEYMAVAEVWVEYPLKNCGAKEVNIILRDILAHVTKDKQYTIPSVQQQLQSIVLKVLANVQDLSAIIAMDVFLPIFDLFTGAVNIQVSKAMLENFSRHSETTSDPVIINTMFAVGKTVHDSINSLSIADEVRQISGLLVAFVSRIDFGRDLEKHLQFYVDCRQAFSNLDAVKSRLVMGVLQLAMRTLAIVRGKHTKKTAAFVRTCLAFCYITIPSMEEAFGRLYLYLVSATCALLNGSLPQEEAFLKAAITLVQEVEPVIDTEGQVRSTEEQLVPFLQNFVSVLVIAPWHPEHGAFFLTKGLLRVIKEYRWERGSTGRAQILLALLPLYASFYQQHLGNARGDGPQHDALYGGDSDFQDELFGNIDRLVDEFLEEINKLKDDIDPQVQKKAAKVALDYINITAGNAELNAKQSAQCAALLAFARRQLTAPPEANYLRNTQTYLESLPSAQELIKKSKS
eukprot:Phypoly_transcript_01433.p1 GENE.Phypoly_transcript_01433~~Phypoly_transcript_01433.p1  ORF type:complete len:962 (+),score=270.31 Phypoly_transcript_01433:47-2932(+)